MVSNDEAVKDALNKVKPSPPDFIPLLEKYLAKDELPIGFQLQLTMYTSTYLENLKAGDPTLIPVLVKLIKGIRVREFYLSKENPAPLLDVIPEAVSVLRQYGPKALAALRELMAKGDMRIRVEAAFAVWSIEKKPKTILPLAGEALDSSSPYARMTAINIARDMGAAATSLAAKIRKIAQNDPNLSVRRVAEACLPEIEKQ